MASRNARRVPMAVTSAAEAADRARGNPATNPGAWGSDDGFASPPRATSRTGALHRIAMPDSARVPRRTRAKRAIPAASRRFEPGAACPNASAPFSSRRVPPHDAARFRAGRQGR